MASGLSHNNDALLDFIRYFGIGQKEKMPDGKCPKRKRPELREELRRLVDASAAQPGGLDGDDVPALGVETQVEHRKDGDNSASASQPGRSGREMEEAQKRPRSEASVNKKVETQKKKRRASVVRRSWRCRARLGRRP